MLLAASGSSQTLYEDPQYGFKMRIPKDFESVPINMAEKWVVAKFLYKRPLTPKKEWWGEFTPEIRVIIFPKVDVQQVIAARKAEQKQIQVKDKDGKIVHVNLLEYLQNPFRGYHEYLRENYKEGGWSISSEKQVTIGGLPALHKVIDVEDKMGTGTKQTLVAWEIDYGDATYVVQFEVIKDYDHKFLAEVGGAVQAFRQIPRTEPLRPVLTASRSQEASAEAVARAKDEELTPQARRLAREADLARAIAKAEEALADGWSRYEDGPFTVFHSTDADFARRVSKQAVLMWRWMEENFGYIGVDHAVGSILRVCKSSAEANSYLETSTRSDSALTAREIVVWNDKDWAWGEWGSGLLNSRIAQQYLADKNRRLWYGLPPWLDHGLRIYIGSLKMKGNKLIAKPDDWDMLAIRTRLRENQFRPAQEVLQATWDTFNSQYDSPDRVQSLAMVNFLFETRHKKYRDALDSFIKALDTRLREFEEEADGTLKKVDNKEKLAKWALEWEKRREQVFADCYGRVFGGWNARTWAAFEQAWRSAY